MRMRSYFLINDFLLTLIEKTADISQCHQWFPLKMASEELMPQFHTDGVSLTQIWVVILIG